MINHDVHIPSLNVELPNGTTAVLQPSVDTSVEVKSTKFVSKSESKGVNLSQQRQPRSSPTSPEHFELKSESDSSTYTLHASVNSHAVPHMSHCNEDIYRGISDILISLLLSIAK